MPTSATWQTGARRSQQPGALRWSKRSRARKPASRPWRIRGLPEGAVVRLDGKEIAKAPITAPVRVGVGTHTIAASADGYDPAEKEVTVAGEDRRVVELALAKHVVENATTDSGSTGGPDAAGRAGGTARRRTDGERARGQRRG